MLPSQLNSDPDRLLSSRKSYSAAVDSWTLSTAAIVAVKTPYTRGISGEKAPTVTFRTNQGDDPRVDLLLDPLLHLRCHWRVVLVLGDELGHSVVRVLSAGMVDGDCTPSPDIVR